MRVGSDFSGVGAFDQALKNIGVDYETVFACDLDKYARITYLANNEEPTYFPNDVYEREIPSEPLDIYMTSPPCQAFSLAGKRKGEDDRRGILFYNSLEFIMENKPRYFIFENVKGLLSHDKRDKKSKYGRTFNKWVERLGGKSINGTQTMFQHAESVPYHLYYKVLNAVDYGVPQNRERIFLIGIRDDKDNNFRFPNQNFPKRRIKDILEDNVDAKYYLSEKMISGFVKSSERHIEKGTGFVWKPKSKDDVCCTLRANAALNKTDNSIICGYINQDTQASKVSDVEDTLPSLCAGTHGYANGYIGINSATTKGVVVGAIRGRGNDNTQQLELRDEILNTITSVQKDNVIVGKNYIQFNSDKSQQQDRAFYEDKNIGALTTKGSKSKVIRRSLTIRRLTPRESFRAMGFQDSFDISKVSDTQAYKQAGNSIVVTVLEEIIKRLNI